MLAAIFFPDIAPKARETKENINKWDYIRFKRFWRAKEIINKIKRQCTGGENIFTNKFEKGLIPKFIKNLQNSTPEKQTIQLKNGQRPQIDTSPKRIYRWPIDI